MIGLTIIGLLGVYLLSLYMGTGGMNDEKYYKAFDKPEITICPGCGKDTEIKHAVHSFIFDEAVIDCICGYKTKAPGMNPKEAAEMLKQASEKQK